MNSCPLLVLRFLLALFPFALVVEGKGVPHGWRLTDRFIGFRYEISVNSGNSIQTKNSIRERADELFCFGWAQDSPRETIVGEIRCKKDAGLKMKAYLSLLVSDSNAMSNETISIRDYPDTLIRLHFSHFKLLTKERNTCFRDEPHKCDHLYDETVDGVKFRHR